MATAKAKVTYRVLQAFNDALTGKFYLVGDKYPANTKKERLEELLGDVHKWHTGPIIEAVTVAGEDDDENSDKQVDQTEGGGDNGGNDGDNTAGQIQVKD